jgi:hypothetical protein
MNNIIKLEKYYSPQISMDVSTICEPLKKFGITIFVYSRIYNNGQAYALGSHWESFYNHWKKEHPVCSPLPEIPEGKKIHYLPFLSKNISLAEKKSMLEYRNLYNFDHPIYFLEKHKDYIEFYSFGAEAKNVGIINFYLSNLDIL